MIATANDHNGVGYGCLDSLSFKTDDNITFGCNARDPVIFPNNAHPSSPRFINFPTPFSAGELELARFLLRTKSNCMILRI